MSAPPGLLKLIAKRDGKLAILWRQCSTVDALPLVAMSLASMDWSVGDIAASLAAHEVACGVDVAQAMAESAIAEVAARRAAEMSSDVQIVAVYLSVPPQVDVTLGDLRMRIGIKEAGSRILMDQACWEHFLRAPDLPSQKTYRAWFDASLQAAERIEAPPEASEEEHERYGVGQILAALPLASSVEETSAERVYLDDVDGLAYIRLEPIMAGRIRPSMPTMTARRVTEILRELGWEPAKVRSGSTTLRLWSGPAEQYAERAKAWDQIDEIGAARRAKESARRREAGSQQAAPQPQEDDDGYF